MIQEQHPDRTRLFNQWKQLEMHLLIDPLNRLDVTGVPIVLLIDQHGVIQFRRPKPAQLREFVETDYTSSQAEEPAVPGTQWETIDKLTLRGNLEQAISAYESAVRDAPDDGRLHFRLGVAYRMRFDSAAGTPDDFAKAIGHWRAALRINPNQYIWRRRIQQYGPVLDKPYPFYNWVETARRDIAARGEQPIRLAVEPSGAELVGPGQKAQASTSQESPDPDNRIARDKQRAILINHAIVPATGQRQNAVRVHLNLAPNSQTQFAWNNEADPVRIWFDAPPEVKLNRQLLTCQNPPDATTSERRAVEFEVSWKPSVQPEQTLQGYALYHVCDKATGTCTFRRQDILIPLRR